MIWSQNIVCYKYTNKRRKNRPEFSKYSPPYPLYLSGEQIYTRFLYSRTFKIKSRSTASVSSSKDDKTKVNKFFCKILGRFKICPTFALSQSDGAIAQLVEQRTENPCVPGSIPGGTTLKKRVTQYGSLFYT